MEYISVQAHQRTGKRLSKSGYSGKRSAINHLVRCQQGSYWKEDFEKRLEILWKGFMRLSNNDQARENMTRRSRKKRRRQTEATGNQEVQAQQDDMDTDSEDDDSDSDDDSDDEDDRLLFQEGKSPMTPELYASLLKWFLKRGTQEGIMCACFLALIWNLAC